MNDDITDSGGFFQALPDKTEAASETASMALDSLRRFMVECIKRSYSVISLVVQEFLLAKRRFPTILVLFRELSKR